MLQDTSYRLVAALCAVIAPSGWWKKKVTQALANKVVDTCALATAQLAARRALLTSDRCVLHDDDNRKHRRFVVMKIN